MDTVSLGALCALRNYGILCVTFFLHLLSIGEEIIIFIKKTISGS